jgi:glutaminyl-peptide cyclotransferase
MTWLATRSACCAVLLFAQNAYAATEAIPTYTYSVVHAYPHDTEAFTEGLFFLDGFLYESTGLEGRSSIRKERLETGEVLLRKEVAPEFFGEGITYWDHRLISVTWTSHVGFVFDLKTFQPQGRFSYEGEGWGLTRNDRFVILSDGTARLRFLNPQTLLEDHSIRVTAAGRAVEQLNELEWVKGQIYANIWQTNRIARIDPANGHVVGWIDLSGLLASSERIPRHVDVLNGIAYDSSGDRLFVTGKLWPRLFEIRLVRKP